MIRYNPKELKTFRLVDFSGGINTDLNGNLRELLQCKNLMIDSKGKPFTRGGSHVLNPTSPIGKQSKYIRGYILGFSGELPAYGSNFVPAATISASSALATNLAAEANDSDITSYWKMQSDKALAGTMTASSGANPSNMNDGNDATAWEAVI